MRSTGTLFNRSRHTVRRIALCGTTAALLCSPAAAFAQGNDSATVRLIQLLIQKGILTQGQAASLLTQAQSEAGGTEASGTPAAARPTRHRSHVALVPEPAAEEAAEAPPPETPPATPGEVRVTYVPQFVRDQIAAQVRSQMMQQVQSQGWGAPNDVPDRIHRIEVYGDLRLRYQSDIEDKSNGVVGGQAFPFPDFNAINNSGGFDLNGTALPPTINVLENRDRYRIRARVGVRAQIASWVQADVRLATGNDNGPVSENQTLGAPGDFSKYAVYVDRAYFALTPLPGLKILAGRTPNPYFVSDLMYAPDLNFDGVAVQYDQKITDQFGLFFNGGVHPVFNTALNFSSSNLVAGSSHDAYLLAAQLGAQWHIAQTYVAKLAAGFFGYSNITGERSTPCLLLTTSATCSTDDTRPGFIQGGNTLFGLRDIVTNASSIAAAPQYYGLASHFGVLDVHGRFDIHNFDPIVVSLEGEFAKNLEYNRAYILSRTPVNNYGSVSAGGKGDANGNGPYQGGDTAYTVKLTVGTPEIVRLWDWNASFGYKYLQTDSVVDAFTDPDFHLGGTNAKGFVVGGNLGVANNTYLSARWLSANEIVGPPNGVDVLQIDLNAKF